MEDFELEFFENTSIKIIEKDVYVSANQISELYDTPIRTIYENIARLKEDGLVVGAEIRTDLNNRSLQVYNLDEILAIGFRLRSEKAILFQRWAIAQLKKIIETKDKEIRHAQLMESIAWNHLDAIDNHR